MTSAPRSPRICPQNGPASTREASSTRTPCNGNSLSAIGCRLPCRFRGPAERFWRASPWLLWYSRESESGQVGQTFLSARQARMPAPPNSREPTMHPSEHNLQVYEELADTFDRQQNQALRDQFLLLAADAALTAGRQDEAERLRQRLLWLNPHHSVRAYTS